MSNIDDLLNSPELVAPEKITDKVIKRLQFRLFGRLFRFDIIREGFNPPHLLAPVEPCQSSEQAAWLCGLKTDPEYVKYRADRLAQWNKEQDESLARMKIYPKDKIE